MIRGAEGVGGASGRVSSVVVHCSNSDACMKLAIYVFTIDGLCVAVALGPYVCLSVRLTEVLSAYQLMQFYFRLVDRKLMHFRAGSRLPIKWQHHGMKICSRINVLQDNYFFSSSHTSQNVCDFSDMPLNDFEITRLS